MTTVTEMTQPGGIGRDDLPKMLSGTPVHNSSTSLNSSISQISITLF